MFSCPYLVIDLAHGDLLNTSMLDNLTQHGSITTTNDEDGLGLRVSIHGEVDDHLLVGMLITLSDLDDSVKNKDVTVSLGLEEEDVLEGGASVAKDLLNLQGETLTRPHGLNLAEPSVLDALRGCDDDA